MTPEKFQEIRRTFEELVDLDAAAREQALDRIGASDPACAAELRRLLREHGRSTLLLDQSPVEHLSRPAPEWRQLGPYTILREIGVGGMGVVYEAARVDGTFRKRAAIKVLRRDISPKVLLARFDQERQILSRLEHPHIATIFDVGQTPE